MYGRFDDECLTVRGLESHVPALNLIRIQCWPRLSAKWRCLLEVADYIGLEKLMALTAEDFDAFRTVLPAEIWAYASHLVDGAAGPAPAIRGECGEPLQILDVLAAISSAFEPVG